MIDLLKVSLTSLGSPKSPQRAITNGVFRCRLCGGAERIIPSHEPGTAEDFTEGYGDLGRVGSCSCPEARARHPRFVTELYNAALGSSTTGRVRTQALVVLLERTRLRVQ